MLNIRSHTDNNLGVYKHKKLHSDDTPSNEDQKTTAKA